MSVHVAGPLITTEVGELGSLSPMESARLPLLEPWRVKLRGLLPPTKPMGEVLVHSKGPAPEASSTPP